MKAIITPVAIKFYTNDGLKQDELLQVLMKEGFFYYENTDGYIVCEYANGITLLPLLLAVCEKMKVEIVETQY